MPARPANDSDREALEVALRQLDLIEANLKRFLDLGRTGDMRRERCSVATVVDQTVALLRPQCRHAHIDLRWQAPSPQPLSATPGDSTGAGTVQAMPRN